MDRHHFIGTLSILLCVLVAQTALAVPKPQRYPGLIGGLRTERPTQLVIEDQRVFISCPSDGAPADCSFTVDYRIANPADSPEEVLAAFYTVRGRDVSASVDGADLTTDLTPEQIAGFDLIMSDDEQASLPLGFLATLPVELRDRISRVGIPLELEPGQVREVSVRGNVAFGESVRVSWARTAVQTRHLLLADRPDETIFDLDYLFPSAASWAQTGTVHYAIEYAGDWLFDGGIASGFHPYSDAVTTVFMGNWSETDEDGVITASADLEGAQGTRVCASLMRRASRFYFGGVLLGLGGALDDSGGFRTRVGVEVAFPDWILYALNVDTDWSDRLIITPTVIAATRSPLFLPFGFGIGVGMPVELVDGFEVGIRTQVDMTLGPLGFVTSFDLFPGLVSEDPDRFQIVMMGQISL